VFRIRVGVGRERRVFERVERRKEKKGRTNKEIKKQERRRRRP
jgi:hypothetical protein